MTTKTKTPWDIVEAHLARTGVLVNGVGRRARATRCPHCRAHVLRGTDADQCALDAEADPTPLTPLGEALAQLEGRHTYALANEAGRLVLNYRDAGRIAHQPAAAGRQDVLAEHRCHTTTVLPAAPSHHVALHADQLPPGSPPPF